MGELVFDVSRSLDGFMTAANRRPEEPMGEGASGCTSGHSATTSATARCSRGDPAVGEEGARVLPARSVPACLTGSARAERHPQRLFGGQSAPAPERRLDGVRAEP